MLKKAKKLIVCFWIIKLQFFPLALAIGDQLLPEIFFMEVMTEVHPGTMAYQFLPAASTVNQDSIKALINVELSKYGRTQLPRTEIFIVGSIRDLHQNHLNEDMIAGLFAPGKKINKIYLEAGQYLVNALHHEMASILMYNYYLSDPEYRKECRQFMKYLKNGFSYKGMDEVLKTLNDHWQFLGSADYAMTNPENDYSLVAEYLFNPRPVEETSGEVPFWDYMDWAEVLEYPVFEKVQRVIALFSKINPQFTESYFRSLSLKYYQAKR
jgi:hypothetical protein